MLNFNLWKHHGLNLDIIENMMPFERDVYATLLRQWLEEENKRRERERMNAR